MDDVNSNTRLIVYGHFYCGQALHLAQVLQEKHVEHEWRDVHDGDPRFGDELRQLARGHLSVPTVVFSDGTVMVEPLPDRVLDKLGLRQPGRLERWLGR